MDVRALKSLYDVRSQPATPAVEQGRFAFSIDAFVARVEALVADDPCVDQETDTFRKAHDLLPVERCAGGESDTRQ
jgi:hypothetical protein